MVSLLVGFILLPGPRYSKPEIEPVLVLRLSVFGNHGPGATFVEWVPTSWLELQKASKTVEYRFLIFVLVYSKSEFL